MNTIVTEKSDIRTFSVPAIHNYTPVWEFAGRSTGSYCSDYDEIYVYPYFTCVYGAGVFVFIMSRLFYLNYYWQYLVSLTSFF